jgi:hypothetical protein
VLYKQSSLEEIVVGVMSTRYPWVGSARDTAVLREASREDVDVRSGEVEGVCCNRS